MTQAPVSRKRLIEAVAWYGGAVIIAVILYLAPEWFGSAWLVDRIVAAGTLALMAVVSVQHFRRDR